MRLLSVVVAVLLFAPSLASAQLADRWDPGRALASRTDLQELLTRLRWTADSSAYSPVMRERARRQAVLVRARLDSGDFQVGDRLYVMVENEPTLKDTFNVVNGRVIALPDIGPVALRGVLRSELEGSLTTSIGKFLRRPVVHSQSLLPITVLGDVARPGFYMVPGDQPLTGVLTLAGGPTRDANASAMRVVRGGETLWEGEVLQRALTSGTTLDELGVHSGDRILVPHRRSLNTGSAQTLAIVMSLPLTIFSIVRTFGH